MHIWTRASSALYNQTLLHTLFYSPRRKKKTYQITPLKKKKTPPCHVCKELACACQHKVLASFSAFQPIRSSQIKIEFKTKEERQECIKYPMSLLGNSSRLRERRNCTPPRHPCSYYSVHHFSDRLQVKISWRVGNLQSSRFLVIRKRKRNVIFYD